MCNNKVFIHVSDNMSKVIHVSNTNSKWDKIFLLNKIWRMRKFKIMVRFFSFSFWVKDNGKVIYPFQNNWLLQWSHHGNTKWSMDNQRFTTSFLIFTN